MTVNTRWCDRVPDLLVAAVDAAFPTRTVADVGSTGPSWNEQNQTIRVSFTDDGVAFLKAATDGDGTRVARERAVIDYVQASTDIGVPNILSVAPEGNPPHLATAALGETSLRVQLDESDDTAQLSLLGRVGRALARLHDHRFDRHGAIVGGDADGLTVETAPWPDVLRDRIALARSVAPAERFAHHYDEVAAAVEANRDTLAKAPAALVHGDPAAPNTFVLPGRVGFIDWELAHVGDPARELHRATDQLLADADGNAPDEMVQALHDGYRDHAGSLPDGYAERKPIYDAERFLGRTGFFENWVEYAETDPETLAERFETEMQRRLTVIR